MQLRPYQRDAVEAVYRHLRERDDNPCVVIPTAGGKTPVIAQICKDAVQQWDGRVLILAHVKELLEQTADKLKAVCHELPFGLYSAGLGSRDTLYPVIIAGIQSAYQRADELGRFDLVIVDEAHLIPPDGEGRYRTLLTDLKRFNPRLRIIGLTATPFRMTSGAICAHENILNAVCYEIGVRELIVRGYLCPLKSKAGREAVNSDGLHVRAGEFVASEVEALMDNKALVDAACREIVALTQERKSVLVFAGGVKHAGHVADKLAELGQSVGTVFGDTLDFLRDRTLADFRAGRIKYLVNVNVLTTGFDAPNIDCVVLLRPTASPGLYYQMVGRGFRLHPGKENCLVLDFGGNVMRHGPVDAIRVPDPGANGNGRAPAKECPRCRSVIAAGYARCPDCGYEFPPPERKKHDGKAGTAAVLSGPATVVKYKVEDVHYCVHRKRGAADDAPRSMRVEYRIGWQQYVSEWVCIEHTGFARHKAELWWKRRCSLPVPDTAEDAVRLAEAGALLTAESIVVRCVPGDPYERVVGWEFADRPAREPGCDDDVADTLSAPEPATTDDDVPF